MGFPQTEAREPPGSCDHDQRCPIWTLTDVSVHLICHAIIIRPPRSHCLPALLVVSALRFGFWVLAVATRWASRYQRYHLFSSTTSARARIRNHHLSTSLSLFRPFGADWLRLWRTSLLAETHTHLALCKLRRPLSRPASCCRPGAFEFALAAPFALRALRCFDSRPTPIVVDAPGLRSLQN